MSVKTSWESFRNRVMPPNASQVQIGVCRHAFYAGAVSMFALITEVKGMPDDIGCNHLDALNQELNDYAKEVALAAELERSR